MGESFSTFDLVKIFGINRMTLNDWMKMGFVEPSIEKAQGAGTKSRFSREDLYRIQVFRFLLDRGFSRGDASKHAYHVAREISHEQAEDLNLTPDQKTLLESPKVIVITYKNGRFSGGYSQPDGDLKMKFKDDYDFVLAVNFEKIRRQVDAMIEEAEK